MDYGIFYIGFDGEGFEAAKKNTAWVELAPLQEAIDYAKHDLEKGFIDSFQIYNESGDQVYELKNERPAA